MSLHVECHGHGPPLVLLHGWGMNADVWQAVLPALARRRQLICVDLPGHARSRAQPGGETLAAWSACLAEVVPAGAEVLGWSLGGLLALRLALDAPERVARLILVASGPRFVQAADWPHAMASETLAGFAQGLVEDYAGTLRRFLAIQALGSEHARETLGQLREQVFRHGEPDPAALRAGLQMLLQTDLRAELPRVHCPTLLIGGERDTLFPAAAQVQTRERLPAAASVLIEGAGHAPFLSHPAAFLEALSAFLDGPGARHPSIAPETPL